MSFKLAPDTPDNQALFKATLDYLKQSDLAGFIIDQLSESESALTVRLGRHIEKNKYGPDPKSDGGTIKWNPYKKFRTKSEESHRKKGGSYQKKLETVPKHLEGEESLAGDFSPAMALLHEMGHAYQRLSDPDAFREQVRRGKKGVKQIENINVNAIENTVALELRAKGCPEGIRWKYGDVEKRGFFKREAYIDVHEPFPGYLSNA